MRALLLLLCLACDTANESPDMSVIGTCPATTQCNPTDQCTYTEGEGTTCVCVSPERVSCCYGGPPLNCFTAHQGDVCCGANLGSGCANGCSCQSQHWVCPADAGI